MLLPHVARFRSPKSGKSLDLVEANGADVETGTLTDGNDRFPVVRHIPRFCGVDNYASTFGWQWNHYRTTQLDSGSPWAAESERRLFAETRWPRDMRGQRILEAGCGMGRFTEVLVRTGADVDAFDYSTAVEAARTNIGAAPNLSLAQADIFAPPYEAGGYDKVMCLGVLQHTPDPHAAFRSLCCFLKPGGEIVIDVYRLSITSLFHGKYYLRPLARRIPRDRLHGVVRAHVAAVFRATAPIHRLSHAAGRRVSGLFSVADYRGLYGLDDRAALEHAELDTFDMLSPAFDIPQTMSTVRRWFAEAGLESIEVSPGFNGIEGRGIRPRR